MTSATTKPASFGCLASDMGYHLPIQVLRSAAGWYIGTARNGPVSRESVEYWDSEQKAQYALNEGDWTQRSHP